MFTRYTTGLSGATTDNVVVYLPRLWRPTGVKPAVILCGGTDDPWTLGFEEAFVLPVARTLTDAGYAVGWSDFGINQYGNANAMNRIEALRVYLQSEVGAKSGKIAIGGFSMGGLNALNYAANNPTKVMCVTGWCPLVDMQYANATPGIKAYLDTAYQGGWSQAVYGATTDPIIMASAGKYADLSIQIRYASNDTVIPLSTLTHFVSAVGGANISLVNAGALNHSWQVVTATASQSAFLAQITAANT